jgi:hypothetical protein
VLQDIRITSSWSKQIFIYKRASTESLLDSCTFSEPAFDFQNCTRNHIYIAFFAFGSVAVSADATNRTCATIFRHVVANDIFCDSRLLHWIDNFVGHIMAFSQDLELFFNLIGRLSVLGCLRRSGNCLEIRPPEACLRHTCYFLFRFGGILHWNAFLIIAQRGRCEVLKRMSRVQSPR